MKAMIFAAGKGTRLKPLTDHIPKALVRVNGIPLIEIIIRKLIAVGVSEIIINVHYLADQIIDFLKSMNNFGIHIGISDETDELLDTGGGLKKASWFFNDKQPFILHNVDIISNINLMEMINFHEKSSAIATLAVRERESSRYFLFNNDMELCGWENIKTSEKIISKPSENFQKFAFSGIHIINPEIFKHIIEEGEFSLIQTYIRISKNHKLLAYQHNPSYWFDIGSLSKLKDAENYLNLKDLS